MVRGVQECRAGERNFADKPGRGRKRSTTTPRIQNKVVKQNRGKPWQSCRKLAARLKTSKDSVHRCLKEKGLKPVQTKNKPKVSEKNIAVRKASNQGTRSVCGLSFVRLHQSLEAYNRGHYVSRTCDGLGTVSRRIGLYENKRTLGKQKFGVSSNGVELKVGVLTKERWHE